MFAAHAPCRQEPWTRADGTLVTGGSSPPPYQLAICHLTRADTSGGSMNMDTGRLPGPPPVTEGEIAQQVVATAVWAPSVHNTQPWWFTSYEREICLHADGRRQLPIADPCRREMLISCGAALFTARLALRFLGYVTDTTVLPKPRDPDLVARIRWERQAAVTQYESDLAGLVRRRRTHRGGFEPVPLPDSLVAALRSGAERDGAALRVVSDAGGRAAIGAIVGTAERVLRLDSARVRELAQWSFPPGSPGRDGVPPTSYPAQAERTDPSFPGRDFALGHGWVSRR
jgi:hypothetical protein